LTTFQVVLSTNGDASFAVLIYEEDPSNLTFEEYQVGFDAGDKMRGVNLLGADSISWSPQSVNIFRIDGNFICIAPLLPDHKLKHYKILLSSDWEEVI
jgi:hypothetical protein